MGLATLPFPGSDFRIEHETTWVFAPPAPDGLIPGTGVSRSDVRAEGTSSGLKIEHTLTQQADGIVVNWDDLEKVSSDGQSPVLGASRGDVVVDDSFDFAPSDPMLEPAPDGLLPGIDMRGDVVADEGEARDWSDIDITGFHNLFDQGLDIWDWYTNPLG
ncbi:MAG: hypothetical protein AAF479_02275 [Pseudomonadota bacterium]